MLGPFEMTFFYPFASTKLYLEFCAANDELETEFRNNRKSRPISSSAVGDIIVSHAFSFIITFF